MWLETICSLLIGLDLWISAKRMKKYGTSVELNPLVRYVAQRKGITAALLTLLGLNVMLLGIFQSNVILLSMFTGAKMALAALQLRSLQLERTIQSNK